MEEVAPKESLEQIIETIPDGIIIIDRDGRITYTNAAAEGIFGLKRSEIIGKTYDDPTLMALTMEGRPIPAGKHPLAKAVQTGEPVYGFEHLHERPDGTRVIVSANAVPLRDKRGSIIGAVISLDDITEQKRAEEALRESERRFREMLEEADIVAVMLDTRGKVTFVNDFLLGLTGWQRNEVIGKDWFDTFVPPEQREQARQFFLESTARGEIEAHYENDIMTSWGERRTILFTNVPLRDPQGNVTGMASIGEDITERKQAAEEVRESRRQVIDILESITDGFFALDNEWRFTYVNRKAGQLLGRRKEELLYRNIWEAFPEAVGTKFYQEFSRAKEEMVPVSFEEFYAPLDKWFELHVYPYENGLSGYFSDITERKRVAEALSESEERLRAIIDNTTAVIYVKDTTGRYALINRQFERIFHTTREEIAGKTDHELFPKERADALRANDRKVLESGVPLEFEENVPLEDGVHTYVSVKFPLRDPAGVIYALGGVSTDITGRKRTEEALIESEERYRLLVELSPDGVAVHSEGKLAYVNPAAVRLLGAETPDKLVGKPVLEFVHPDYREAVIERIKQMQQGKTVGLVEEKFIRLNGEVVDVEVTGAPVIYQRRPAVMVIARDITERKQAEEARRETSQALEALVKASPLAIIALDPGGNVTRWNPAAERIFSWSEEEVLGQQNPIIPEDRRDEFRTLRERALRGESITGVEVQRQKKDGTRIDVSLSAAPLYDASGNINGIMSVVADVTERKRIEEECAQLVKRMQLLLESTDEGIYELNLKGEALLFNRAAARMTGYTPEEVIGRNAHELIHHHRVDGTPYPIEECPIFSAAKTGQGTRVDTEVFWRKDGSSFPVEYSSYPIIEDEEIKGAVVTFTDITERKRAEELSAALNDIQSTISSTLDFHEIMQRVIVESARAIGAETALIALREDNRWIVGYAYGYAEDQVGKHLTVEEVGYVESVVKAGRPVAISDAYADPRIDPEMIRRYGIRSILAIPLIVKGKAIGILMFIFRSAQVIFTNTQIDFATKLGTSMSLALENARLYAAERNIADTLQEALLIVPKKVVGIEFGHLYRSATDTARVGGDFYELFEVEHRKVGIVIGDVSGKGLGAATLTSLVKNTIKAYAYEDSSPASVMARVNDVVRKTSTQAMFVTVFFGILNTETGHLSYCSAGHPPGILKRKTLQTDLLITSSPAIGAFTGLNFIDDQIPIEKGDVLLLYTDGVTEARCNHEFFGEERLVSFIKDSAPIKAERMPEVVFGEVMECTGGMLSDDIVLLAVSLQDEAHG